MPAKKKKARTNQVETTVKDFFKEKPLEHILYCQKVCCVRSGGRTEGKYEDDDEEEEEEQKEETRQGEQMVEVGNGMIGYGGLG